MTEDYTAVKDFERKSEGPMDINTLIDLSEVFFAPVHIIHPRMGLLAEAKRLTEYLDPFHWKEGLYTASSGEIAHSVEDRYETESGSPISYRDLSRFYTKNKQGRLVKNSDYEYVRNKSTGRHLYLDEIHEYFTREEIMLRFAHAALIAHHLRSNNEYYFIISTEMAIGDKRPIDINEYIDHEKALALFEKQVEGGFLPPALLEIAQEPIVGAAVMQSMYERNMLSRIDEAFYLEHGRLPNMKRHHIFADVLLGSSIASRLTLADLTCAIESSLGPIGRLQTNKHIVNIAADARKGIEEAVISISISEHVYTLAMRTLIEKGLVYGRK